MKGNQQDSSGSDYGERQPGRNRMYDYQKGDKKTRELRRKAASLLKSNSVSVKRDDESVESDEFDDEYFDSDQKEPPQLAQRTKSGNGKQKSEKKDENINSKRFVLFLMLSPTLIYFLSVVSEMFPNAKLALTGNANQIIVLIGAVSVILICIYYKPFRPFLKYIAIPCILVCFFPSIQVYRCSPIDLNNSDVGTLVRLNANGKKLLEDAYAASSCQKSQLFKTPFKLSLYNPNVRLWVKTYHIINLNMYHQGSKTVPNRGPDAGDEMPAEQLPYKLYLFISQRSVKKQIYHLSLLVLTSSKMTLIDEILQMNESEKQNVTFHITGKIENLRDEFIPTKKELQKQNYLIRPLMLRVKQTDVIGLPEEEESA